MSEFRSPFLDVPLNPDPVIEAYKRNIDRTLLRENLRLTVQERIDQLAAFQRFLEDVRRAGESARAGR